ncbi:uncharacterized protein EV154DRAFT_486076 [Mucor mucedo]|uniref:uncharacterized protein n=1 Tax=Mucor mucedo TaxID=29922 RepID=UPI00221FA0E2|nr:uncharacterized protein EV154DRAFT_486076 [Mucor mucedo]KAI7879329.1 hypothetical protein EV154DRAFT_486076 [Mucor mucedo]
MQSYEYHGVILRCYTMHMLIVGSFFISVTEIMYPQTKPVIFFRHIDNDISSDNRLAANVSSSVKSIDHDRVRRILAPITYEQLYPDEQQPPNEADSLNDNLADTGIPATSPPTRARPTRPPPVRPAATRPTRPTPARPAATRPTPAPATDAAADEIIVDIEEFNNMSNRLHRTNRMNDYINLQLCGVHTNAEGNPQNTGPNSGFTVDIDMIGVWTDYIPTVIGAPISLNLDPYNTFTSKVSPFFHGTPLNKIQNISIARFGHSSRFNLSVFFPIMRDPRDIRNQQNLRVDQATKENFVNNVLFPALRQGTDTPHLFPVNARDEMYRKRTAQGTFAYSGVFIPEAFLVGIVDIMREIIHEENMQQFRGFFVFSHGYGFKQGIEYRGSEGEDVGAIVRENITDIDWQTIPNDNVVFDLAVNIGFDGYTGLWVADHEMEDGVLLATTRLMWSLFDHVVHPAHARYRHDIFSFIKSVGGCRYVALDQVHGEGQYNILSMQAYHAIKTPFYSAHRGSDRLTHDCPIEALALTSGTGTYNINGTRNIFQDIRQFTYPARFEVSLHLRHAQDFYDAIPRLVQGVPVLVFYPTEVICDFEIHTLFAIEAMLAVINELHVNIRLENPSILTTNMNSHYLLTPDLFFFNEELQSWDCMEVYEANMTMFTPEGRKALETKRLPIHVLLLQLQNVLNEFEMNDTCLFDLGTLDEDDQSMYTSLNPTTFTLVNMIVTEGLTELVAVSLVNCFSQDLFNLISNTNAFRPDVLDNNVFTLANLNNRHLLNEVFAMPVYVKQNRSVATMNNTFDQVLPNVASSNLNHIVEIIRNNSRIAVIVYSRTAYIIILFFLVKQNCRAEAEVFHQLLCDTMFDYVVAAYLN